jgi:hypothetical protein
VCIVIDVNRIPSVFNSNARDHFEFQPILDCVRLHGAKIIYGGTKYKTELSKMPNYYGLLVEMRKAGQVYEADEQRVNMIQQQVERKTRHTRFNDQAIVAIVIVSKCRFICSSDQKSYYFFKLKSLYPSHFKLPIIYNRREHRALLNHRHIRGRCGPCTLAS